MDIEDIVTREYVEVDIGERLGHIRSLFERENPKGIIVTEDGEFTGLITEKLMLQSHIEDDAKAGAMMRQNVPHVDRKEDVRTTARMLAEGDVKVAPVFEGEKLWGIVTEDALLEAVLHNLDVLDVEDIYTENVITIGEDETLGKAINTLRENRISRLPVLNDNGYLVGMVTRHDIVDVVIRDMDKATTGDRRGEVERIIDLPVYDFMNSPATSVPVGTSVQEAVETMLENDYAGLVITREDDDRLVRGIVTKTDVLRALSLTEEDHMVVQITNIELMDAISRTEIREEIEQVADKYQDMQVHHAHVRFHKHKETLRGTPLIYCQTRLWTNQGQVAGTGEGYGADAAFRVALDLLERNVLDMKEVTADEEYRGQLLRKLGEL